MKLVLPYPPSANRYWRNVNGRVLRSKEATAYKHDVWWTAFAQDAHKQHAPLMGDVVLHVDIYRPQRSGDLDNRLKVLIDALKGVAYGDDKQVIEIHARRFDDKKEPRVEVTVEEQK